MLISQMLFFSPFVYEQKWVLVIDIIDIGNFHFDSFIKYHINGITAK